MYVKNIDIIKSNNKEWKKQATSYTTYIPGLWPRPGPGRALGKTVVHPATLPRLYCAMNGREADRPCFVIQEK